MAKVKVKHLPARDMEHDECILCATCIDVCPRDVIAIPFRKG